MEQLAPSVVTRLMQEMKDLADKPAEGITVRGRSGAARRTRADWTMSEVPYAHRRERCERLAHTTRARAARVAFKRAPPTPRAQHCAARPRALTCSAPPRLLRQVCFNEDNLADITAEVEGPGVAARLRAWMRVAASGNNLPSRHCVGVLP